MKITSADICNILTIEENDIHSNFLHGGKRLYSKKDTILKYSPLITLITVVKNGENYLEETFKSVFEQSFKDFEYIVIDGGSTDNTIEKIRKYEDKIDYWISEKDKGIYDAFNKGLTLAKGKLIGFVNSDDVLMPSALEILSKYYREYPTKDFFFGSVKKLATWKKCSL